MNYGKLNEEQIEKVKEIEKAIDIIIRVYGISSSQMRIGQGEAFVCNIPYKGGVLRISRYSKSSIDLDKSDVVVRGVNHTSSNVSTTSLFLEGDTGVLAVISFGPWIEEVKKISEEALKFLESYGSRVDELSSLHQRIIETDI